MVLGLAVVVGVAVGLLLGGRLERIAELRLRGLWLLYAAVGIQVVAFPFAFMPWRTGEGAAKALWLISYGLLIVAAIVNRRVTGAPVVALGMALNLVAVVANGGSMPALPGAIEGAGMSYDTHNNSVAAATPHLPWLVDRWPAPEWVPLANVFSVGDVVIAIGAVLLVVFAMGVGGDRRRAASAPSVD
ncbi:MAG TPA: DUF5317 domain-containing protein [Gaiellaceae bacterium]|nr:DUF5317 domain-containing protein [Gaiellaceae bacterium]